MTPVNIVFVPVAVPTMSNNGGWQRHTRPPPYPHERHDRMSERKQAIPSPRDDRAAQRLLDDARRAIAEKRHALAELAREGRV